MKPLMKSERFQRLIFTLTLVLLSTYLHTFIWSIFKSGPYILYYPVVALCAFFGNGYVATILSASLSQYLFYYQIDQNGNPLKNLIFQFLFVLSGLLISYIGEKLRREKKSLESLHHSLSIINDVGPSLTSELNMEKLVQHMTDSGTKICNAQFGAFFYNSTNDEGKTMLLYAVSGVPKEAFSKFPNPRATEVFYPTFMGQGTLLSGDITQDPRYGKNTPYRGLPEGHLPVKSYLGVSVKSNDGNVIGGLFFGHEEANVFTEEHAKIIEGLAAQTAVAMDNARLYLKVKESVKSRDEFLSVASHELKTPLTTLKLQAQLRFKQLQKNEYQFFTPEALNKMVLDDIKQIDRITRLIDDMLDISRISTGKLSLHPEVFDLSLLVSEIVLRYEKLLQDKGVEIHFSSIGPLIGKWDRMRIEQVVTNLLTNASRYGKNKPIYVDLKKRGALASISVTDEGMGIAKENFDIIFNRFERAISANEISGLGLGLYISRQIVEMHKGKISVESELNKGSTFTVELPIDAQISEKV